LNPFGYRGVPSEIRNLNHKADDMALIFECLMGVVLARVGLLLAATTPEKEYKMNWFKRKDFDVSLSSFVSGFPDYISTCAAICRHPFRFPASLKLDEAKSFKRAFKFAVYSSFVLFVLLLPAFILHGTHNSKLTFIIRVLLQLSLYAFALYMGLRLVRAQDVTVRKVATVYFYLASTGAILICLVMYPLYLGLGPSIIFASAAQFQPAVQYYYQHPGLAVYVTVINFVVGLASWVILPRWFSVTHGIGFFRAMLAMVVAIILGIPSQIFILNPVLDVTEPYFDTVIDTVMK